MALLPWQAKVIDLADVQVWLGDVMMRQGSCAFKFLAVCYPEDILEVDKYLFFLP